MPIIVNWDMLVSFLFAFSKIRCFIRKSSGHKSACETTHKTGKKRKLTKKEIPAPRHVH